MCGITLPKTDCSYSNLPEVFSTCVLHGWGCSLLEVFIHLHLSIYLLIHQCSLFALWRSWPYTVLIHIVVNPTVLLVMARKVPQIHFHKCKIEKYYVGIVLGHKNDKNQSESHKRRTDCLVLTYITVWVSLCILHNMCISSSFTAASLPIISEWGQIIRPAVNDFICPWSWVSVWDPHTPTLSNVLHLDSSFPLFSVIKFKLLKVSCNVSYYHQYNALLLVPFRILMFLKQSRTGKCQEIRGNSWL